MTLSMQTVIAQIRDKVAEVSGFQRVYAPSETDGNRIPPAFNELPCALVLPGENIDYILSAGGHRHTYQVLVQVFEAPGGDLGEAAYGILPMVDALIEKFAGNIALADAGGANPRANSCVFASHSAFSGMEYGGQQFMGMSITLRVSEQATATPALGS